MTFGMSCAFIALGCWAIKQVIRQIRGIAYESSISKHKVGKDLHKVVEPKLRNP